MLQRICHNKPEELNVQMHFLSPAAAKMATKDPSIMEHISLPPHVYRVCKMWAEWTTNQTLLFLPQQRGATTDCSCIRQALTDSLLLDFHPSFYRVSWHFSMVVGHLVFGVGLHLYRHTVHDNEVYLGK